MSIAVSSTIEHGHHAVVVAVAVGTGSYGFEAIGAGVQAGAKGQGLWVRGYGPGTLGQGLLNFWLYTATSYHAGTHACTHACMHARRTHRRVKESLRMWVVVDQTKVDESDATNAADDAAHQTGRAYPGPACIDICVGTGMGIDMR